VVPLTELGARAFGGLGRALDVVLPRLWDDSEEKMLRDDRGQVHLKNWIGHDSDPFGFDGGIFGSYIPLIWLSNGL
jgi:hypothetical protein